MRTCRTMLVCGLLVVCLSGCCLVTFLFNLTNGQLYAFRADITVGDLSAYIHWNETPTYTREYAWRVLVDVDANAATGDTDGFDMYVQVSHLSDGVLLADEGELIEELNSTAESPTFGVEYFEWDGGWVNWAYETSMASIIASGNTVTIAFDYLGTLDPAAGFRTRFFTLHYPPPAGPAVNDETSIVTGSVSTTDAEGDAGGFAFIDIVSARIEYYLEP